MGRASLDRELESCRLMLVEMEARLRDRETELITLRKTEEKFRKIFEHTNDAIFLVDPDQDVILDVNRRACSMLGYAREELLSVPMSLIHPHEMPRLRAFAQSVFEQGQGWTNELSCLTKHGDFVPAEVSASLLEIEGKQCMIALVRDISQQRRLEREREYLLEEFLVESKFGPIIGRSEAIQKVLKQVEMVAPTDAGVLITGESGTGKELIARAIHTNSLRSEHPLVRVNCASVPRELFESEFFGHVKGAFTGAIKDRAGRFELADKGTLFLDEIGDIPLDLQGKLLRVLQEGQYERIGQDRTRNVDVRIIAATNHDLMVETRDGSFRQDLYYRLRVFPIDIPPLRERREDIALLTTYFVEESCRRMGLSQPKITNADLEAMESHDWPGNIRELQNIIERAVILAQDCRLRMDLPSMVSARTADDASARLPISHAEPTSLDDLKNMERHIIIQALQQSEAKIYGKNGAAKKLGLKPTTLISRMKKMGLHQPNK